MRMVILIKNLFVFQRARKRYSNEYSQASKLLAWFGRRLWPQASADGLIWLQSVTIMDDGSESSVGPYGKLPADVIQHQSVVIDTKLSLEKLCFFAMLNSVFGSV